MLRRIVIGLLAVIFTSVAAAAQMGPQVSAKATDIASIQAKMAETGKAEVVVEFALPGSVPTADEMAADLSEVRTGVAEEARTAAVRRGQDRILADTFGAADEARIVTSSRHIARMKYSPRFTFIGSPEDLERLARHPSVTRIHPIRVYELHLDSALPVINVGSAHAIGWKGENTYVAILDSGVQNDHPFFTASGKSRVVFEACFSNSNVAAANSLCPGNQGSSIKAGAAAPPCAEVPNECDHGTHVAGIAAGGQTSGSPMSGVAPEAKIIAVQIGTATTDSKGKKVWRARNDDTQRALEYVYGLKMPKGTKLAAVNMSIGGGQENAACPDDFLAESVRALAARTAVVISAGNDGYRGAVGSPGCIPEAVTVSASDDKDRIADFSNIDDVTDVFAPGVDIVSSVPGGVFKTMQGTSMAAPMVAGAFAVIREAMASDSTLSSSKILYELKQTGVPIKDNRPKQDKPSRPAGTLTKPRIDVAALLKKLEAPELSLKFSKGSSAYTSISGRAGGPFGAKPIEVQAFATQGNHYYELEGIPPWLRVTPTPAKGYVDSRGSKLFALVTNDVANGLEPGTYTASMRFATTTALPAPSFKVVLDVLPPAPPGDDFEDPLPLDFVDGRAAIIGDATDSSLQKNEPLTAAQLNRSIWFKLVAPITGVVQLDTNGSDFNTALGVYRGSALDALTLIKEDNSSSSKRGGDKASFDVTKNSTYYVQLGSPVGNLAGFYKLNASIAARGIVVAGPDYSASGPAGGPFESNINSYSMSNPGLGSEDVMIQDLPTWLQANPSRAVVPAGGAVTVKLKLTAQANSLPSGVHNATITFRDMVTGKAFATRKLSISVGGPPPADALVLDDRSLISSGPQGGPFSPPNVAFGMWNSSATALQWSFTMSPSLSGFITTSQQPGVSYELAPRADTWHTVYVNIDTRAQSLAPGVYSGQVIFKNETSGKLFPRDVQLTVNPGSSGNTAALVMD